MAYIVGDYFNNGRFLVPTYEELLLEKDTYAIKNLQEKINKLKNQNNEQKKRIIDLEKNTSSSTKVKVPPSETKKNKKLKVGIDKKKDDIKKLGRVYKEKKEELERKKIDLQSKENEINKLTSDLSEKNDELERLQREIGNKDSELEALKFNLNSKDEEIKNKSEEIQRKNIELRENKEIIIQLQKQIDNLKNMYQQEIEKLKQELTSLKNEKDKLNSENLQKIINLEVLNESQVSVIVENNKTIKKKEEEIENLKRKLNRINQDNVSLIGQIQQKQQNIETLKLQLKSLGSTSSNDNQIFINQIEEKNQKIADLKRRLQELIQENQILNEKIVTNEQELEDLRNKNLDQQSLLDKLKNKLGTALNKINSLSELINQQEQKLKSIADDMSGGASGVIESEQEVELNKIQRAIEQIQEKVQNNDSHIKKIETKLKVKTGLLEQIKNKFTNFNTDVNLNSEKYQTFKERINALYLQVQSLCDITNKKKEDKLKIKEDLQKVQKDLIDSTKSIFNTIAQYNKDMDRLFINEQIGGNVKAGEITELFNKIDEISKKLENPSCDIKNTAPVRQQREPVVNQPTPAQVRQQRVVNQAIPAQIRQQREVNQATPAQIRQQRDEPIINQATPAPVRQQKVINQPTLEPVVNQPTPAPVRQQKVINQPTLEPVVNQTTAAPVSEQKVEEVVNKEETNKYNLMVKKIKTALENGTTKTSTDLAKELCNKIYQNIGDRQQCNNSVVLKSPKISEYKSHFIIKINSQLVNSSLKFNEDDYKLLVNALKVYKPLDNMEQTYKMKAKKIITGLKELISDYDRNVNIEEKIIEIIRNQQSSLMNKITSQGGGYFDF